MTVAEDDKPLLLSLQQKETDEDIRVRLETALALLAVNDWQNEGL